MKTPSQILWHEAGEPAEYVDGVQHFDETQTCATCGGRIECGVSLEDTFTGNEDGWPYFADANSEWVCRGCDFVSKGRWKDQFRLWSILWCEDGGLPGHYPSVYESIDDADYPVRLEPLVEYGGDRVQITCRGGVKGLLALLLDPPECRWFAAIADSGKKKIHRFAPITAGDPYEVQFEYQTVRASSTEMAQTLFDVASLRALGVSEDRIRTGRLDPSFDREHARRIRWHSRQLDDVRGHPRLSLAMYCCTQETLNATGRKAGRALISRGATRRGSPLHAGDAQERVDRRDRAQRLVEARASGPEVGGTDGDDVSRASGADGGQPPDSGADQKDEPGDQIDLFAVDGA